MKFLHTGDWHIGKKIQQFDLLEEQKHAYKQMLALAKEEQVDGIIIAGDLYDRAIPSVEAVDLLNDMLYEMNIKEKLPIYAISGNHDSANRLNTGSPWYKNNQFYLYTTLAQAMKPIEIDDVQLYLLPFIEPFQIRQYFEDDGIKNISQGMECIIETMQESFDENKRQILVGHFFASGSLRCDSETQLTVGGLDMVPISLLEVFDYVALGHLHYYQALKHPSIRYSGSLLKYSLSEVNQPKGVYIVEVNESGVSYEFHPIEPLNDIVLLTGSFKDLCAPECYQQLSRGDYYGIRLEDKQVIPNVMQEMRKVYPRILNLERVSSVERPGGYQGTISDLKQAEPLELFADFFKDQTGDLLSSEQKSIIADTISVITQEES